MPFRVEREQCLCTLSRSSRALPAIECVTERERERERETDRQTDRQTERENMPQASRHFWQVMGVCLLGYAFMLGLGDEGVKVTLSPLRLDRGAN